MPDLVGLASWVKAQQLQDADELKVNRIAVTILVAALCGATAPLGLSERCLTVGG